jgi:polyphosphate kinase
VSERIRVRSIVGRFLEHSRIFYFHNGGEENVYLSSADWMPRNFFRRVEVCFPVFDPKLKKRVIAEGLMAYLEDNTLAWLMAQDGTYESVTPADAKTVNSQERLLQLLATTTAV